LLIPKLVTTLRSYDRSQFTHDLVAGVVVGIVALPLAIAFAIASGVTPERGLWTAIIAGFIVSAFGGSRVQIAGPTGAFVVIVYGIVQQHGVDGLAVATVMAGVMLVACGLARFGSVIKFIPHPLVTGFTAGIAVIIFAGEIKDVLGLHMGDVPPGFVDKWVAYSHAATFTPAAVGVAALTFAIMLGWPRVSRRVPGPFVALLIATVAVQVFSIPVETIGSRFGSIATSVPAVRFPRVSIEQVTALVGPAFTIAMLGAIESLLSAVVADGMIGGRHRSNMELVAQGAANIVVPFFGGIPSTGAIARTATNVRNGGRTPVAGIIHAATLLAISLAAGRWASLIPMAALGAILVVVAYHMSEWRTFVAELRAPGSDVAVLLATFLLTVFVDLTVAIAVGMILAAFLFIRRMAEAATVHAVGGADDDPETDERDGNAVARRRIPAGVHVFEISGAFFFGAVETFKDTIARVATTPRVLILRMRHVLILDSSAMKALRDVVKRSHADGTLVLVSEVHMQPLVTLTGSRLLDELGRDKVFDDLDSALNRARRHLGIPEESAPADLEPTLARAQRPHP
jgi:SulP family sulfate permease